MPDYNIAIECQGKQHFIPVNIFGGEEGFKYRQELDFLKYELCKKNGIKIFYYSDFDLPFFQKIETDFDNILEQIKNET